MHKVTKIEDRLYDRISLSQSDENLIVALGSGGYSMIRPPGRDSWAQYTSEYGLPTFIATVARAICEDKGVPLETAIPQALKRVKAWASGKYGVNIDTKERAIEAMKQWNALQIKVSKNKEKIPDDAKVRKDRKSSKPKKD